MSAAAKLLIIEDDSDVAAMLVTYFQSQGYQAQAVPRGEEGLRLCQSQPPDLVILDIRLPDVDGFEVARRLRSRVRTAHTPILFLTERRERSARLQGLALGADDYLAKPFDLQELGLRVRNALRRASAPPLTHPITGLPQGAAVERRWQQGLQAPRPEDLLVVSVLHLKAFRERYGFVAADDVLRAVALILQQALQDLPEGEGFLGHLSATDFVLFTPPAHAHRLEERLRQRLDRAWPYFYPLEDRWKGDLGAHPLAFQIRRWAGDAFPHQKATARRQRLLHALR